MYKLFKQAIWDEHGRQLVNAVYTDDLTHPRSLYTEPCYDQDTPQSGYIKWWQCSTDEVLCDGSELISFTLCQYLRGGEMYPPKCNIVFNKQGEMVLLCTDAEWHKNLKAYGSIENYLKTQ